MIAENSIAYYVINWIPWLMQVAIIIWLTMLIVRPLREIATTLHGILGKLNDMDKRTGTDAPPPNAP